MLWRFGLKTCFVARCGSGHWLEVVTSRNFSDVRVKSRARSSVPEACPEEAVCWGVGLCVALGNCSCLVVKKCLLTVLV